MQLPTILFQDDDLLVVIKPAGITVNRADTTRDELTLQDWTEKQLGIQNSEFRTENKVSAEVAREDGSYDYEEMFRQRGGIVHRLDKETSGIILVAKHPKSFEALQKQFKERVVKKTYLALVHGHLTPQEGEINAPVGRLPWNRRQFGVFPGGREAKTTYKVISVQQLASGKSKETVSFVRLFPETGRTHQIRVHMKHLQHPIFADFLYAGRKLAATDRKLLSRVFLHAESISFIHPTTNKEVHFTAPLPQELQVVLNACENRSN